MELLINHQNCNSQFCRENNIYKTLKEDTLTWRIYISIQASRKNIYIYGFYYKKKNSGTEILKTFRMILVFSSLN